MKTKIVIVALVLIVALAMVGCVPIVKEATEKPSTENYGKDSIIVELGENVQTKSELSVTGAGSIKVMPDVAYVTVGVTTNHKNAATAQSQNKDAMNAIFAALKEAGLSDDDMRTTNYSTTPRYNYDTQSITAYEVRNMVELTITDIDNVGKYIDIAAENGANTSYPVNFSLLDQSGPYNEALKLAMTTAMGKAEAIISASGNTIVGTLRISENSFGYVAYEKYDMVADVAMDEMAGAPTPITAGELEITANVTVVYEIN
ncbi:MAG: SIMPL domain-containing protein [Clostridia bacterium]|jgi:uncharacterized protein|nr:SIMPL domain-containing protein [Clostridia bacterium]